MHCKKGKLRETLGKNAVLGNIEFELQSRKGENPRWVCQEVRAMQLTIRVTQRRGHRGEIRPFTINVIHTKK